MIKKSSLHLLTLGNVQLNQIRAYMVFATPTQNANQEAEPKMEILILDSYSVLVYQIPYMLLYDLARYIYIALT